MNLMPSNRFTLLIALAASLTGLFFNAPLAIAIDDVKVHTSGSTSANVLIYKIAQERGFYKEEKLNVLTIAATSSAGIQGLVGGSFDFSQILGQTSAAILHGAPLKNVMVFDTRPLFWFFGSKKIRRIQDLKGGKLVGVSSLGANTDQMTREVLAMNGIDPRKDVVIQGTRLRRSFSKAAGATPATLVSSTPKATCTSPAARRIW
jgi:ABC-type nitrate/sulfonate/bicarbonate transport system substrate-binding protein